MDFIPSKNADLVPYLVSCSAVIFASPTTYGLTSGQASTFQTQAENVQTLFAAISDPSTRTSVNIADFNTAKALAISTCRQYNQIAQLSGATSAELVAAGFPVRDTTRSPQTPVTESVEMILVSAVPEQVRITTRNPATPTSKAKPANTGAVQLAIAVGTVAAVDPDQATEMRFYTRSPLTLSTSAEQRGKVLTVFARYESKGTIGGIKVYGPWSTPLVVSLP